MGKDLVLVVGFENICRLCLHSTDAMSNIFPSSGKTTLQQQIYYITGLATKKGDGLPSKICHRCRHIVELASELREVVQKSQKILEKTGSFRTNSSHYEANVMKEADSEPFDNETFLQSLTGINDNTEPNLPEEQYSKPSSPEDQCSRTSSPNQQYSEPNSPEEQYSAPNSPQKQYIELNTVFLPDNVDHTTEITAEEVEEEELARKKRALTCELCNTQFESKEEVRPHVIQHYANAKDLQIYLDIKSAPYLCTVCDEVQKNKAQLMKHHRKHLGINAFRCLAAGCRYVAVTPAHLRRHRSVHDLRRRQCALCRELFCRRDLLLRHIARAHPEHKPRAPADTAKRIVTEIEPYRSGSRWFTREYGHYYVICRQRDETSTLRCHREGCPARFNIKRAHAGPVTEDHNHPPTPWVPSRNSLFQALKKRATEETIPLSTIYKEEVARFPAAETHLPFPTVAPSMRKWRRAARPHDNPWGRPADIEELS